MDISIRSHAAIAFALVFFAWTEAATAQSFVAEWPGSTPSQTHAGAAPPMISGPPAWPQPGPSVPVDWMAVPAAQQAAPLAPSPVVAPVSHDWIAQAAPSPLEHQLSEL